MISFVAVSLLLGALMLLRMPIAFAMGLSGVVGLALQIGPGPALATLERSIYHTSSSFLLVAVPLFILMAHLLTSGGVTGRAIAACQAWIGHVRGGLAIATIGASVLLAAMIGSSTASAAAMAASAFPEMRKHKYNERLAAAVVSVGGTLAVVVPPSIVLVVYGVLTETSIGNLFIAGLLPGLLTAFGLAVVVMIVGRRAGAAPKGEPFVLRRAVRESREVWPATLLILLVIGSIYGGYASPSEAAAIGVMGALLIGLAHRSIGARSFASSVDSAMKSTVMIIAIIACSAIFANYLAFSGVTQDILTAVKDSGLPRHVILVAIVVVLLLMGMVMDQLAILSLALPLVFPAIKALGFDPVWFGIIVTKTVEIGLLTPPLGLNAYVTAGQTGVPLNEVFRGLTPFILMELVILSVLIAFPEITLALLTAF